MPLTSNSDSKPAPSMPLVTDIELHNDAELKPFQFTSQDITSLLGLRASSPLLAIVSVLLGFAATLISQQVSDILKHISILNPDSNFNQTISLFLFSNVLTLHLFMIVTKVIFGIIGNYQRKVLIISVLMMQAVLMISFPFFESQQLQLHIVLILVQSLMSIVILIKIWIVELSNIEDRDQNICNFHVNLGISVLIVYSFHNQIESIELQTQLCAIILGLTSFVIQFLPESPIILDQYNQREDCAESLNYLVKIQHNSLHKQYKVILRYKSFDCERFEVNFFEFLTSFDDNCVAQVSILLCSICKGFLTSLNNFMPHYLVIHHMNIHSQSNITQQFGMITMILALACGFVLKNRITSKKFIIIQFSIAKMFLELVIQNYAQLDKIYFSQIMLLIKSLDLTLFWLVVAYLCECTPTHFRSAAIYLLVIAELVSNQIGLTQNQSWNQHNTQYISIAVLVTGVYGGCINLFWNQGVERDRMDISDCLDLENIQNKKLQ